MILKIFFIIYLSLYLFLSACSPMNIITSTTSAGVVVAEGDRTVGESVDDAAIKIKIADFEVKSMIFFCQNC